MAHARHYRRRLGPLTAESPLSPREARFALEYVVDFNGAEAARKAGYAKKAAHVQASQLLTRPNVQAAVERAKQEWMERAALTVEREQRDIVTAANLDPIEMFAADGRILHIREMPPHVRRAIVSIEVVKRNMTSGDGSTDEVVKIRFIDKARMHEILARTTGLDKGDGMEAPRVPAFALPADTKGVAVH
jgi:phage terminase small subunit